MERITMRKFLLVAAAAAIALVGLSANTCGGGEEQKPAETQPTQPEQPEQPAQ